MLYEEFGTHTQINIFHVLNILKCYYSFDCMLNKDRLERIFKKKLSSDMIFLFFSIFSTLNNIGVLAALFLRLFFSYSRVKEQIKDKQETNMNITCEQPLFT